MATGQPYPAETLDPNGYDARGVPYRMLVPQAIERRWSAVLSLNERVLLMRLQDMTIQWGRVSVDTSLKQITDGRVGDGEWRYGAIGFAIATTERSMRSLKERGLVDTALRQCPQTGSKLGLTITVNLNLILADWENDTVPPVLPKRKRDAKPAEKATHHTDGTSHHTDGTLPSHRWDPPITVMGHNTGNITGSRNTGKDHLNADAFGPSSADEAPGDPLPLFSDEITGKNLPVKKSDNSAPEKPDGAKARIEADLQKIRERKNVRAKTALQAAVDRLAVAGVWERGKRKDGQVRGDDIETLWRETVIGTTSGTAVPAKWTAKQRGMGMELFNRWAVKADGTNPNGTFVEFVTFVITDWKGIVSRKFSWMTQSPPPDMPELHFVQRFFGEFEDAFVNRERRKVLSKIDIDEVEELVAKGFSHAAALEEVARRKVESRLRREVKERGSAPYMAGPKVQPVAAKTQKTGLPERSMRPTSVVRDKINQRSAADWEAELFGPGKRK